LSQGGTVQARTLSDERGAQIASYALVFQPGDEVIAELTRFAKEHELDASEFTALGAFSEAMLGFYDVTRRNYERIPVDEQSEVLTLVGNITLDNGSPKVHAHVVLGLVDGSTRGGHLLEGYVRPTLELVLTESPVQLRRQFDPEAGLALIQP
jgi:predicted DNA-binding protein with PD1-like motif